MIRKRLFVICIVVFAYLYSYSQNDTLYGFYYANATRHYWVEDNTSLNIVINNLDHFDSIVARLRRVFNDNQDEIWSDDEDNNIIVNSNSLVSKNIQSLFSEISLSDNDISFYSFAKKINGRPIWLTNEIYVKLKNNVSYSSYIQPILLQYPGVVSHYEGNNEYRFICPTDSIVVNLANYLYDTTYVVYSAPDYYCLGNLHTNDPYFNDQWNLKNTGQNGGTVGVDIKVEEAWLFLQKAIGTNGGSVKVAVIDDGVEEHEDFYEDFGVCVVLDGYTANGDGTGRPRPNNKHGECCAGIIAAVHNHIGIAGVAPHSRIVPIRIIRNLEVQNLFYMFSTRKVAKAIEKSWTDYGASILSCSWQLTVPSDFIEDALVTASNQGRNGKGCVIVFSSGNDGSGAVGYPGSLAQVLSVGSVDKNGHRVSYSNRGWELDLSAPDNPIITTDRMGDAGYCNSLTLVPNYHTGFSGTSAACPHVSGVVALMMSVNPNLTREQVFQILENTAQKVGGYDYNYNYTNGTWDEETAYGLVDAHKAVVESALHGNSASIVGACQLQQCEEYDYLCNIGFHNCFTYEWTTSNNLAIVYSASNMIKVMPVEAGNAYVEVTIYSEGRPIRNLRKNLVVQNSGTSSLVPLSNLPYSITGNVTWDNDSYFIPMSVTVENEATLTITGNVCFSRYANIFVKPGGRLIIDGGILTNYCEGEMWPGIQVWGNSSLSQYPDRQGNYLQGYLELKNGATIENAVCAVELWKPEDITTTGGIIIADSAFFINNAKAVHALAYSNISPYNGYEMGYLASFDRCTFAINSDYLGTETFYKHVDLAQVKGVRFNGCSFSSDPNVTGVSPWCSAIAAYDAGFSVNGLCDRYCNGQNIAPCPDQCLVHSTFSGFYDAIHAQHNVATIQPFTVRDAVFSGNDLGIYAINTGYPNIHDNTFYIGRILECAYGVYVENLVNFVIEENDFYRSSHYSGDTYGIGVFGSPAANDVYLNSFNQLTCGNLSVGLNIVQTQGFSSTIQGLTYTCNQNSLNGIDFCVLKDNGYGDINPQQGLSTSPAGNTFSGSVYHFYNDGNNGVDYYYQSGATSQTPNSSLTTGVTTHAVNAMKRCYSHNHGGLRMSPQEEKAELEKQYQMAQANFERFVGLYNELIESGGNEEELAELRRQVAYYANERSRAACGIVRINLNDTVTNPQELRTWLRNAGDIASDRLTVASFAQEGDFDSALELAGQLPSVYGLTDEDLADHADYMSLLVLFKTLHDSGRTTAQLTEEEIRMVEGIAANTYGVARLYAKVLLDGQLGDRGARHLCPTLPQEDDKERGSSGIGEYQNSDFMVTVSPNPAYTQIKVAYTLPKASANATLSLVNVLGEKVTEVLLNENKGSTVIDLSHVPSGIYVIIVKDQNGNSCSKKLVKK